MPMDKYDRYFGGKKGSASKAKSAMRDEYGEEEGERVFYATKNKHKGKGPSARHAAMALGRRGKGGKCCPGGK